MAAGDSSTAAHGVGDAHVAGGDVPMSGDVPVSVLAQSCDVDDKDSCVEQSEAMSSLVDTPVSSDTISSGSLTVSGDEDSDDEDDETWSLSCALSLMESGRLPSGLWLSQLLSSTCVVLSSSSTRVVSDVGTMRGLSSDWESSCSSENIANTTRGFNATHYILCITFCFVSWKWKKITHRVSTHG